MDSEDEVAALLSEFARTLLTDFSIQDILDHLVTRIVKALPVTAAGVTLISPGMAPRFIAASDKSALRYEELQTELGEGPCLLAYESGEAVQSPDLRSETRFPAFATAALEAGLAAAFTCPLRHGSGRLGALDLYRDTPGLLGPREMVAAQTLADIAAGYILNAEAREEARKTSDRFRESALHDPLTGLPNRLLLQQRLEHAARRAERSHTNTAVLFADLDDFKKINDTHGHQVGDELLVAVANRLSALLRPGDTLARLSGDEFVILFEDLHQPADINSLATRIGTAMDRPFPLSSVEVGVTASVGVAYAGPGEAISNQLIVDADMAMYEAKGKNGAARQMLDLRDARRNRDDEALGHDLRNAFSQHKLEIAYQPIVRSVDGLVTGAEALLRWTHPIRGVVPASDMVALAETNGLISGIGAWVLEASCESCIDWRQDHPAHPLDLSVNVSAHQMMGPHFYDTVAAVLERTGMDPATLVLEVTEGVFIQDSERALMTLTDLKTLGVRLALDDFGTGYSSLSYLQQFPVDIIKIDRGFLSSITLDPVAAAIVSAVTNLAHTLGLHVIAEGVETRQQRERIVELGCESAQGFLFAKPMPTAALSVLLAERDGHDVYLPA